jgi:uncharacterized cupin superfamily protein
MEVVRHKDANTYEAPLHHGARILRLQGADASPSEAFSVSIGYFEPGGGAEMTATATEKVYMVLEGEITVMTADGEAVLGPLDSCHLAKGEARAMENRADSEAQVLVLMTYPPQTA